MYGEIVRWIDIVVNRLLIKYTQKKVRLQVPGNHRAALPYGISHYRPTAIVIIIWIQIYKYRFQPFKIKIFKIGDVVTLRKVFGTTRWKKIGKKSNSVITKWEHKKGLFFCIYKDWIFVIRELINWKYPYKILYLDILNEKTTLVDGILTSNLLYIEVNDIGTGLEDSRQESI